MKKNILIHYGEIYLKGANRGFFEKKLISNIRLALKTFGKINLRHVAGRIIIQVPLDFDFNLAAEKLEKIFGIEYFALAYNVAQDYKEIEKAVGVLVEKKKFKTFRITSRRTNKSFAMTSLELDIKLGDFVRKKFNKKVNLDKFDLNIHVDIFQKFSFVYLEKKKAKGGLPVGSSGNLLCLLSGGIDSPVAANLMQKRGSKLVYAHFDAYPATPKENSEKVKDLVRVLNKYQFYSKLYIVPFLSVQKEIIKKVPEDYRIIFYRRMMLKIGSQIASQENILGLITGDSLGQVASQTVENIRAVSQAIDLPVLRPCIGLNKEEIVDLAKHIGTYDLSIQPFGDCCSLYVPKSPITHANLNLILNMEKNWQFQKFLDKAICQAEIINIK